MTTYVNRMENDVTVEDEPETAEEPAVEQNWEQLDRVRRLTERLRLLHLRTRAEGFDD